MAEGREFKYTFGLSFPGLITNGSSLETFDFRTVVEPIARSMATFCGERTDLVLYDLFHQGEFARFGLSDYLKQRYNECELIVAFLCSDYAEREWCQAEWNAIYTLATNTSQRHRVMFLWHGVRDDAVLDRLGLEWRRDGFLDINGKTCQQIWLDIHKRYHCNQSVAVATGIGEILINQPADAAQSAAAERGACDTIALFIHTGGEEKEKRAYRWNVFVQWQGDARFVPVPENQFSSDPGFKSVFVKSELRQLIRCIRSWMVKRLVDYPLLDIYAPTELLDVDWESFCVDGKKSGGNSMRAYQHYLLRSSDRLLLPELNIRMGALRRMSDHLINGTGVWLPQEQLSEAVDIETMSGEALDNSHTPVAISFSTSDIGKSREAWLRKSLRSAIVSMSPLIVWPAKKCQLNREHVDRCLTLLSINRVDDSRGQPVNRPHCPDQARLAKLRQQKHRDNDIWGLRILVDHPNRSPDRTMLQSLLSCGESSSKHADRDSSVHQQPLIST